MVQSRDNIRDSYDPVARNRVFAKREGLCPKAMQQFLSAIRQPFVKQAALMPDAHLGYSLPIGSVVATEGMVLPSWVGYDIGCGMCAVPTSFTADDVRHYAQDIHHEIHRAIPTGFNHHKEAVFLPDSLAYKKISPTLIRLIDDRKGHYQLGTLGGGNHFIEVGADEEDTVWIIIHSGSRGVGHGTAQHYMREASGDGKVREGHFGFAPESNIGQDYLRDHDWCVQYALENRQAMITAVVESVQQFLGGAAEWEHLINRSHNHVEKFGQWYIHRKGATHAEFGMKGVIPGNMRDGSFIVRGLGNPDSLMSSSHGAGRLMSRTKAKAELNEVEFVEQMKDIVSDAGVKRLDEAPGAYKDIFEVMDQQKELVETIHLVKPILNVKG